MAVLAKDIMEREVGSCRSRHMGVLTEREKMFGVHALYHIRTGLCVHSAMSHCFLDHL
jgi:hypothetical protein